MKKQKIEKTETIEKISIYDPVYGKYEPTHIYKSNLLGDFYYNIIMGM